MLIILLLSLFVLLPSGWKSEEEKEVVRYVYEYGNSSGQVVKKSSVPSEEKTRIRFAERDDSYYSKHYSPEFYDLLGNFKYIQLSSKEKAAYIQLSRAIDKHMKVIPLDETISFESLSKIYEMMTTENDVQMYFTTRVYNYSYDEIHDEVFSISPQYRIDVREERRIKETLNQKYEEIISGISGDASEEDKILYFHDYLARNCDYHDVTGLTSDELVTLADTTHFSDAYGALIEREAVCEGYARAYKYLCDKSGITCGLVSGSAGGEEHMWNIVKLKGQPYCHVDVTWDDHYDIRYGTGNIIHDYFRKSDEEIGYDHVIDKGLFDYPVCPKIN